MINKPRGHCVPSSLVEKSRQVPFLFNESSCPDLLNAFVTFSCHISTSHNDSLTRTDKLNMNETIYCMNALEVQV